jgi:hypothetical protein
MATKKVKNELQVRNMYTDVTEHFDTILNEDVKLTDFVNVLQEVSGMHGPDAEISVSLEGDDWDVTWNWTVSVKRQETVQEQKERLKQEKQREKEAKRWATRIERDEKKEYLRLKKKFEGKV